MAKINELEFKLLSHAPSLPNSAFLDYILFPNLTTVFTTNRVSELLKIAEKSVSRWKDIESESTTQRTVGENWKSQ